MYKLGAGMFATSLLLIGWVLYKLLQGGMADEAVFLLIIALFVGGLVLVVASGKM